jgi:3-dehydroquinate synthase
LKLKVNTSSPYNIYIDTDLLPGTHYQPPSGKILIIVDQNVYKFHSEKLKQVFSGTNHLFYILPSGEKAKSLKQVTDICNFLIENRFTRSSEIIAVGGGVTGDISSFVASIYMRGIKIIHIPTTLLAMVDSSIGGKTGINFNSKKNIIGTFYQPSLIISDISFLSTLPVKELQSGMGEVIKYAFLTDHKFFDYLLNNFHLYKENDSKFFKNIISISASFKASVVEQDEKEQGLRKLLNLGHTFAHAFESASSFKIKHGIAVAAGIICMLFLSEKHKLITPSECNSYLRLPSLISFPPSLFRLSPESVFNFMQFDKKNTNGSINLILSAGPGKTVIDVASSKNDILYAITRGFNYLKS